MWQVGPRTAQFTDRDSGVRKFNLCAQTARLGGGEGASAQASRPGRGQPGGRGVGRTVGGPTQCWLPARGHGEGQEGAQASSWLGPSWRGASRTSRGWAEPRRSAGQEEKSTVLTPSLFKILIFFSTQILCIYFDFLKRCIKT